MTVSLSRPILMINQTDALAVQILHRVPALKVSEGTYSMQNIGTSVFTCRKLDMSVPDQQTQCRSARQPGYSLYSDCVSLRRMSAPHEIEHKPIFPLYLSSSDTAIYYAGRYLAPLPHFVVARGLGCFLQANTRLSGIATCRATHPSHHRLSRRRGWIPPPHLPSFRHSSGARHRHITPLDGTLSSVYHPCPPVNRGHSILAPLDGLDGRSVVLNGRL